MRKIISIIWGLLLLSTTAFAAGDTLDLRMEALKERGSVYTSVTDLYELDILTPESARREQEYRSYIEAARHTELGGLFAGEAPTPLSEDDYIRNRAAEMGLFLGGDTDELYLRPQPADARDTPDTWLVVAVIVLLCIAAFWFSNWWHKRKKRRNANVYHSNTAGV